MIRLFITFLSAMLILTIAENTPKARAAGEANQQPSLNAFQDVDHAKLEWAVEILDADVLYRSGFENGDDLPYLNFGGTDKAGGQTGGQSFTKETSYKGTTALKIVDTYTNGQAIGNADLEGNISYSNFSRAIFSKKYLANGTSLSVSFRAKTSGSGRISPISLTGKADYGSPIDVTFLNKVNIGDRTVKVSNPQYFKNYIDQGTRFYLANKKGEYTAIYVTSVSIANSTITVNSAFQGEFQVGDKVLQHTVRTPVRFPERTINTTEWELFNVNTTIANYEDYNTLTNGFEFAFYTYTRNTVYIDELKMGHATRTQLYRDNQVIYDGLLSDFDDEGATDKARPAAATAYTISKTGNKVNLQLVEPNDNGTNYNYKVKAISNDGKTSFLSDLKTINIKSGIKGYSFIIDKNSATIPNNTMNSTSGKIEIPINTSPTGYLHIKAIDNSGNVSDTVHIPLQNIIEKNLDITVPSIKAFETIQLKEQPITYQTSFNTNVTIRNFYPSTEDSWRLSVSASPLQVIGGSNTLPRGTISLEPPASVIPIGETIGNLPVKKQTIRSVIDNGSITILEAAKGSGIGEYELSFPDKALNIVIDPTTAKIGKYETTLTWDLISAP